MKKYLEVHCELTNKCILECLHCSSQASEQCNIYQDLDSVYELIENLKEEYDIRLILTGGEPFLISNTKLLNFIEKINSKSDNIEIGFFTTGITDNIEVFDINIIEQLKNLNVKFFYVSVYHIDSKIHDYMTQIEGSYDKTMSFIHSINKMEMDIRVNLVLTKFNIDNIHKIIEKLFNDGVGEIRILKLIKHGRALSNWEKIGVSLEKQYEVIETLKSKKDNRISFGGFQELEVCQKDKGFDCCMAGINKIYIDIQGNIYFCGAVKHNDKFLLGTIKQSNNLKPRMGKGHNKCLAITK